MLGRVYYCFSWMDFGFEMTLLSLILPQIKPMKNRLIFLFTLSIIGLPVFSQDLSSGLIAHYKFEGNFNDDSGLNNHGTNGGATLVANRNNLSLKAANFNGTNQSVVINNSVSLSQISNEVTISLWANIDGYDRGIDGKDYAVLVCKANNENKAQFRIALTPNSFSLVNNGWLGEINFTNPIIKNTWVHLTAVIKDTLANVFVNGIKVGSGILNVSYPFDKNSPLTLGRDDAGSIEYFNGKLDDIRIYGRAVSNTEVTDIFNTLDYTIDSSTLDLIAYYPFDGNLNDYSGNLNNGNAFGGTYAQDRFGRVSKAYNFDGNSQYIEVQNSSSLQLPTRQISFATWVNVNKFTKGTDNLDYSVLLCKSNSDVNAQFRIALTKNGISVINNGKLGSVPGVNDFVLNTWYHVVSVIEDSLISYYLNGELLGTAVAPLPFGFSKNNKLYIGKDEPGGLEYFNGKLDETKIYARKLLPYEIRNIYQSSLINGMLQFELDFGVKLYPNPATNLITIESEKYLVDEVSVYDMQGRELPVTVKLNGINAQIGMDAIERQIIFVRAKIGSEIINKVAVLK